MMLQPVQNALPLEKDYGLPHEIIALVNEFVALHTGVAVHDDVQENTLITEQQDSYIVYK